MPAAPSHALLLAGGVTPSSKAGKETSPGDTDYVSCRHNFRVENRTSTNNVSSPLETAMVICCESMPEGENNTDGTGSPKSSHNRGTRSGLHRPVFPSNYTIPDDEKCVDDNLLQQQQHQPAPATKNSARVILRSGKEGHFVKLLMMYCANKNDVSHRALALAILQRTVDWEKMKVSKSSPTFNEHSERSRVKSFLVAGGMKLLAQWLVDSFTVVPVGGNVNMNVKRPPISNNNQQYIQNVASPNGCLLLPILRLLKAVPFEKQLVLESKIHKSVKRLKKALNIVARGLDPTALESEVHPIAGGLSVGKVIAAVDSVMSSWSKSFASSEKDTPTASTPVNPFEELQKRIRLNFDALDKFQHGEAAPPSWLPPQLISRVGMKPTPPISIGNASSNAHPSSLPPVTSIVTSQEVVTHDPPKRKLGDLSIGAFVSSPSKMPKFLPGKGSQRKISWASPLSTSRTLPELNMSSEEVTNLVATLPSSLPESGGLGGKQAATSNPVINMSSAELASVLSAVQSSLAESERKDEEIIDSYTNVAAALPVQNNFAEGLNVQPAQGLLPASAGGGMMETNNVQQQQEEEDDDDDMDDLF